MLTAVFELARPLLQVLDPEQAHELTLRSLEAGIYPRAGAPDDARLAAKVWGLDFPNPIGIAAGFDKDARVPDAILGMGFGYAEVGTLTPRPQVGNPRPRIFRLPRDQALINRLGFNNGGHEAALGRLERRVRQGVVGVNVGSNKDAADRVADYVSGIQRFYDVGSYFAVNISSPNTPGLRDLQAPSALDELLARILRARAELVSAGKPQRPVVVKLAPDIAEEDLEPIARVLVERGVDGVAVSNSTLAREGLLETKLASEAGGVSGLPLFHRSTVVLARIYVLTGGRIPLIGIGGIHSPETAIAKLEAGATLLQLYTGLVFEGPGLIARMKKGMLAFLDHNRLTQIGAVTGRKAKEWAQKQISC